MQENAPQWDPIAINHVLPWEDRLLILYLLFTCIFLIVRAVQITLFLWVSRKAVPESSPNSNYSRGLALASVRGMSLRRAAVLTILLSLLTLTLSVVNGLRDAITEKFLGWGALGIFSEALGTFAGGLAVCAALYASYAMLEGKLSRRRLTVRV